MEITARDMIFQFLGGLALFLFGIKYMSDGLRSVAGDRMRLFLEKGTKTPVRGVLTGVLVTALLQSSSGTTILTVGLVNVGLLNLRQAIGVIMGANIGTTVTAYLIGFQLQQYALPVMALGIALSFFFKNKSAKLVGQTLFGFGVLFYGLNVMGGAFAPLQHSPFFLNLMTGVENSTILGVGIGVIFTMIVQSSSATVGILQEMAFQGAITYNQAVPILFGDNIGTTITALLASIGASVAARRTALTHTLFNLTGTLIFLPLFVLGIFPEMVRYATEFMLLILGSPDSWNTVNIRMQLAQTHGVFNIANMLIHLPFVALLAAAVSKLIPGKMVETDFETKYLEPRLLDNASVALGQVGLEVSRMGKYAHTFFKRAGDYLINKGPVEELEKLTKYEEFLDKVDEEVSAYIVRLSGRKLSIDQAKKATVLLKTTRDFERIGDHCDNIAELAQYTIEHKVTLSEQARADLVAMMELTGDAVILATKALQLNDKKLAKVVLEKELRIDEMEKVNRAGHIQRLNETTCTGSAGAVFLDLLSNLERIADHAVNIATYVLEG